MRADMSWVGVLEHHAVRTPDKPLAIFGDETVTYGEMADARGGARGRAARPRRAARRRRRTALVQLHRVPRDDLRGEPPRRDRDADQLAARRAGAAVHPRPLGSARARVRRVTRRPRQRGDHGHGTRARDGVHRAAGTRRVDGARRSPRRLERRGRVPAAGDDVHRLMYTSGTTGRPKGVMLTHANLAWKNLAHIVEFGFTSADLGLACGPLYHVGALDLTTTSLIAAGATTIIHRVFDAAEVVDEIERSRVTTVWLAPAMVNAIMALPDIERTRPLVGAGGHQRRREDADPAHRADPADVPVGVVRRRLRPHRDGLGRHVPRPRQHRAASSAASAVRASTSSSTSGTRTAPRYPRANAARSSCAARRCSRATGATPTRRARRSRAAGSTPATSACWTTTATSSSSTDSRT